MSGLTVEKCREAKRILEQQEANETPWVLARCCRCLRLTPCPQIEAVIGFAGETVTDRPCAGCEWGGRFPLAQRKPALWRRVVRAITDWVRGDE